MRHELYLSLTALLAAAFAVAQQTPSASPPQPSLPDSSKTPITISVVTAPQLLPSSFSPDPDRHCQKLRRTALVYLTVDAIGHPDNIHLAHPSAEVPDHFVINTGIDNLAMNVVADDRFTPGTRGGVPAAVTMQDEVILDACAETVKTASGQNDTIFHLRSKPSQKLALMIIAPQSEPPQEISQSDVYKPGGNISAPIVVRSAIAQFSDDARRAHYQGVCLIGLIVDAQGNPQNVHVVRALGMGLDEKAMEAIRQYRFRPALKDGKTPVPVMITIEVDFRLTDRLQPF